MAEPCFTYIITIPGQHLCKIGISRSPETRLAQLRTGSPFGMRLAFMFQARSFDEARYLEQRFHKVMADRRTSGEWFALHLNDALASMALNLHAHFIHSLGVPEDEVVSALLRVGFPATAVEDCIFYAHEALQ